MLIGDFIPKALSVPFVQCGRDWDGWDCWGLVYVAHRELFGVSIATLNGEYDKDVSFAELNALVDVQKQEWNEVSEPRFGDVALFRVSRFQSHVALMLERGQMIHSSHNVGTVCERLDGIIWTKRHAGFFRHFSRCGAPSAQD